MFMPCDPGAFLLFYSNIPQEPALMFYSSNEIAYEKVHRRILLGPIPQSAGSNVLAHAATSGLITSGWLLFVCLSTAAEAFPDTGNQGPGGRLDVMTLNISGSFFWGGRPWCRTQETYTLWQCTTDAHCIFRDIGLSGRDTLALMRLTWSHIIHVQRQHLPQVLWTPFFIPGSLNLLCGSSCLVYLCPHDQER